MKTALRVVGRGALGLAVMVAICSGSCTKRDPKATHEETPTTLSPTSSSGHILVAVTVDWEGVYLSDDGLDMLDALRRRLPKVPFTHFVSAAYFTKENVAKDAPQPATEIKAQVKPGDEVAIHVHAWRSLIQAAKVDVHLAPSFLTGTDKLVQLDGDTGFDSDLDNYSVPELRAIIATSRRILTTAGLVPSMSFRAGGYLGTPKVLEAARAEGLLVDSSALDHRQLEDKEEALLRARLAKVWPTIQSTSQPYVIKTASGNIFEVPIAVFMENADTVEVADLVQRAHAQLAKTKTTDIVLVLGFHQETAHDFGPTLLDALDKVNADPSVSGEIRYVTIEGAAKALGSK